MYKINSTYTYGVISQDVQFLHQLTDHDILRNKAQLITTDVLRCVYRYTQVCLQVHSGVFAGVYTVVYSVEVLLTVTPSASQ